MQPPERPDPRRRRRERRAPSAAPQSTPGPEQEPTPSPEPEPTPGPESAPTSPPEDSTPSPEQEPTPPRKQETTLTPEPTPGPEAVLIPVPEAESTPGSEAESTPSPEADSTPSPEQQPKPHPEADSTPSPEQQPKPHPEADSTPSPEADSTPGPEADSTPSPEADSTPGPEADSTPSPEADSTERRSRAEASRSPAARPDRTSGGGELRGPAALAWETLRSYEDPARYVRMLASDHEEGVVHPLLRAPAGLVTVSGEMPDTQVTRTYLRRSCDITVSGGVAAAVTYPLAACALAEEYLVRRIGGASAASATAAAIAAAELGRRVPPPAGGDARSPSLPPGFAGLAQLSGWLAGDRDREPARDSREPGDTRRLVRLLPPAPALRSPYRLLSAVARRDLSGRGWWSSRRAVALAAAVAAVPGQAARLTVGLVWAGVLLLWIGLTVALLRSPTVQPWVAVVATLALLVTALLAGAAATVLAAVVAVPRFLRDQAPGHQYGLVPGVPLADEKRENRLSVRLDRLAGVPDTAGTPPLMTWLTDALDDLAGLPRGEQERRALTFGDLWLGRPVARSGGDSGRDAEFLRRAAADPERRAIELRLVATDLTRGRPVQLPLALPPDSAVSVAQRWLFCPRCLGGGVPPRVVEQTVAASHRARAQWAGHRCPRHGSPLLAFPDPWDVPVVVAVRLAVPAPGFLSSVPLYVPASTTAPDVRDQYGGWSGHRPETSESADGVTTHWFCGGGAGDAPVSMFDAVLPRWPTFALTVENGSAVPDGAEGHWVDIPEPAADAPASPATRIEGLRAFLLTVPRGRTGWRDRAEAEVPGTRGRIGVVRRGLGGGEGVFLTDAEILRLALRGHHAGRELRNRFTGRDGDVPSQTMADRYRWVRLRSALRDYRRESLEIAARLPYYADLAATYRIPAALTGWFTSSVPAGRVDPSWADAAAALTHLRSLGSGGVLDWNTEDGAPPPDVESPRT